MRLPSARRSRESGSVMLLFTLMLPTMLIPLAGLAIDASVTRLVQLRLQAAVDGAVLGAGRLLGTPAVPETLAAEFLTANFRTDGSAGTWNAANLVSSVVYTPGVTKRIDVNASAQVPTLFMRIFGFNSTTVAAAGSATRSDSRVVFVLDRSGSMGPPPTGSNVIVDAKNDAIGFVKKFMPGADELGLVVFDGSAVVGYPTGAWTSAISLASTGGPNKTFNNGTANDMPTQLAAVSANSGTGMADALTIAYIELQKAHMRDLADPANLGVDTRLNAIFLLTDGVPTAVSLYLNNPANTNANNIVKSSSTCINKTIVTGTAANMMKGWLAVGGSPPFSGTNFLGVDLLASTDTTHTSNWWMSNGGTSTAKDVAVPGSTASGPYNGCPSAMLNNSSIYSYLTRIPDIDMWGNPLTGTGYRNSSIAGSATADTVYTSGDLDQAQVSKSYHWALAMWNAVDNAARNIRLDTNRPNRTGDTGGNMNIQFEVIGFTGNGGVDEGLLRRVANDKTAVGYDSAQPSGKYYSADNPAELADAFNRVASDLLRLAR